MRLFMTVDRYVSLGSYQSMPLGSMLKIGDIEIVVSGVPADGDIYIDVKTPVPKGAMVTAGYLNPSSVS